jgi:hypothetical protein
LWCGLLLFHEFFILTSLEWKTGDLDVFVFVTNGKVSCTVEEETGQKTFLQGRRKTYCWKFCKSERLGKKYASMYCSCRILSRES